MASALSRFVTTVQGSVEIIQLRNGGNPQLQRDWSLSCETSDLSMRRIVRTQPVFRVLFTVIRPCKVQFFLIENPTVRTGAV